MPSPAAAAAPRWEVFLSSTIRDLETFRSGAKAALERILMSCFPSEGWVNPHAATEARCRRMFDRANSYLLVLGYWYGWVEQAGGKSITHKEFDWAIARWGVLPDGAVPPMAVLLPLPNSSAATQLRQAADALIAADAIDAAAHDAQLRAFHADAMHRGRTVQQFRDLPDLRELVIILTREWQGDTAMAAARAGAGAAALPAPLAAAEFGDLGREAQLEAAADALAEFAEDPASPALALFAHGVPDAAESCFLERLLVKTLRQPARRGGAVLPTWTEPALLCEGIARLLGLPACGTPQLLAERVADQLREQPLAFVLDRVGAYPGGAAAAHAQVWAPLVQRLRELHAAGPLPNRLVAVWGEFSGQPPPALPQWVALPPLAPLTRVQLRKWLTRRGVAAARQAAIIDDAMTGAAGDEDPLALRVVSRLRRHDLNDDRGDDDA